MTAAVIAPVVPPSVVPVRPRPGGRLVEPGWRRPPVARLAPTRVGSTRYRIATVDRSGRLADRGLVRHLGWVAGTRLTVSERGGLVQVIADGAGPVALTGQGFLRLPAAVRYWCRLAAGDRLLLAADPADGLLLYPPAALDAMTGQFRASGGVS